MWNALDGKLVQSLKVQEEASITGLQVSVYSCVTSTQVMPDQIFISPPAPFCIQQKVDCHYICHVMVQGSLLW